MKKLLQASLFILISITTVCYSQENKDTIYSTHQKLRRGWMTGNENISFYEVKQRLKQFPKSCHEFKKARRTYIRQGVFLGIGAGIVSVIPIVGQIVGPLIIITSSSTIRNEYKMNIIPATQTYNLEVLRVRDGKYPKDSLYSFRLSQKKTSSLQFVGGAGATFISRSKSERIEYAHYTTWDSIAGNYNFMVDPYNIKYSGSAPAFSFGMLWEPLSRFKRIRLCTGILYERKDYTINPILVTNYYKNNYIQNPSYNWDISTNTFLKGKAKISYFIIPLIIRAYLGNSKQFFFEFGTHLGFRLARFYPLITTPQSGATRVRVDYSPLPLGGWELPISVGGGWLYPFTEKWFFSLETRYKWSTSGLHALYFSTGITRKFSKQ